MSGAKAVTITAEHEAQIEMADVLAEGLYACGYDDINRVDLLDCLASARLKLGHDKEMVASTAYFQAVTGAGVRKATR